MIIDFHIHSKYSFDCFLEPASIVAIARAKGIDGLAIADHDTMAGVAEFKRLAPDLYIIAGQEISTREGDVLGIFLKEEIKACADADEAIRAIRQQGGLAILAHPFKWPHLKRSEDFLRKFDAIEVFNARNNIPVPYYENRQARRAMQKFGLAHVAGSDVHEGFEMGHALTIFDFSKIEANDAKIKKAILEKRLEFKGREVSLGLEVISHFTRLLKTFFKK
jgi:predicted metal-dependent phosphoesterase TrpH